MPEGKLVPIACSYPHDAYRPAEIPELLLSLGIPRYQPDSYCLKRDFAQDIKDCVNAAQRPDNNLEHKEIDQEQRREILLRLARTAEELGESYPALRALSCLKIDKYLREFAERSLAYHSPYNAYCAFCLCRDRDGIYRSMLKTPHFEKAGQYAEEMAFAEYIGEETYKCFERMCSRWVKANNANARFGFSLGSCSIMANALAGHFDIGLAIADSGLFSGFTFKLFGLPVKVAHASRCGRGATFRWQNERDSRDFTGKKVLLLDKDVASGRTIRRAIRELRKLKVETICLALNHSPDATPTSIENVPAEVQEVFYPTKFSIVSLKNSVQLLEQKLQG